MVGNSSLIAEIRVNCIGCTIKYEDFRHAIVCIAKATQERREA